MRAGILKETFEIWWNKETVTEFGSKQSKWEKLNTIRCAVKNNGGGRTIENNEIVYPYTKEFIVRHYVNIAETMRIKYNDKFYRVISIEPNKYYNDKIIIAEQINE